MILKLCDKISRHTRKYKLQLLLLVSSLYALFIYYQIQNINWRSTIMRQVYFSDGHESRVTYRLSEASTVGKVIKRDKHRWEVETGVCIKKDDFVLSRLKIPLDIPIFVYPKEQDQYVSTKIIDTGKFAINNLNKIVELMRDYPKSVFLDIGANVGVFAMTVAMYGFRVIAVESLHGSIMRLCSSMVAANLSNKVTIVHNAAGDLREEVTHKWPKGYISYARLVHVKDGQFPAYTILLDDLLEIYNIKNAVIKMDVFGKEDEVLNGAHEFFKRVKVEAVLLRFEVHKVWDSGKFIVNFLASHGLEPAISQDVKTLYGFGGPDTLLFLPRQKVHK